MIFMAYKELGEQNPPVMADNDSNEEVAERVRLLRRVVKPDMNCAEFAQFLGVTHQRLNNVENGYPLGNDLAKRIVSRVAGITLDWLQLGRDNGVQPDLAQRLLEAASEKARTGT